MADNVPLTALTGKAATDQVTYSGDADAHVQLIRLVDVTGAEGSRTITALVLPVNFGGTVPAFGSGANGATVLRVALATDSPGIIATGDMVSGVTAAMTGTSSTSLLAAPGASLRNYVTTLVVSNSHATVNTDVLIQDGSGGTTLMVIPAAALYGGSTITLPTPLRQPTANTALFCANVTTGASTRVTAVGYKSA